VLLYFYDVKLSHLMTMAQLGEGGVCDREGGQLTGHVNIILLTVILKHSAYKSVTANQGKCRYEFSQKKFQSVQHSGFILWSSGLQLQTVLMLFILMC